MSRVLVDSNVLLDVVGERGPWTAWSEAALQAAASLARLAEDTGVGTVDVARRTADFGVAGYFPSHEPWLVAEPMTLEPSESYSRADLDEYADILAEIVREAYESPETVLSSPERSTVHKLDQAPHDDPERWALTWRAYLRKHNGAAEEREMPLEAESSRP